MSRPGHLRASRFARCCAAALTRTFLLPLLAAGTLRAGVVTDGSLGAAGALPGPAFQIPASLGKKVDANLFHSFSEFNLTSTESATFTAPAGSGVQNVFSRVTGPDPSSIDGLLRSTIPGANFYLLNPHGVMFGANASVDVGGSFAVVTGDHIALSDGKNFNAKPGPADDLLTSAPPAAFGFLPANAGPISVQGSVLTGAEGATWSFIGGEVKMKDATVTTSGVMIRGGKLVMENSKLATTLKTPADRVDVKVQQSLAMSAGSSIRADAAGAVATDAVVDIAATDITLSGTSAITSTGSAATRAGNVRISAGTLTIIEASRVDAETLGPGAGGDVEVIARDVTIHDVTTDPFTLAESHSGIGAKAMADGPGGNVQLNLSGKLALSDGGRVEAFTFGLGAGGDAGIVARDVTIRDLGSGIAAQAQAAFPGGMVGRGGNVRVNLSGQLVFGAGGTIQTQTDFGSVAPGGSISVVAKNVSATGGSSFQTGIIANTSGAGAAGDVRLTLSGHLELVAGAQISSETSGAGAAGEISITAKSASIAGQGVGTIPTGIETETQSPLQGGRGGNVHLRIDGNLTLTGGGEITAGTNGSGDGGSIDIVAGSVLISGAGASFLPGIIARTTNATAAGHGGDVQMNIAGLLNIVAGGKIAVSTSGSGAGGSATIEAQTISVSGKDSQITAATSLGINGGAGGNLALRTAQLLVSNLGEISASTTGTGAGGSLEVAAQQVHLNGGQITADTMAPPTVDIPVKVSNLMVTLDIDHSQDQNLDVALFSLHGGFVDLFNGVGGTGQNFHNTVLSDSAPTSIADGTAPFTGTFRPLMPLAAFDGFGFNDQWVLLISNANVTDTVTLNSWALTVGKVTVSSPPNLMITIPGPDGSNNNLSFLTVNVPPAATVPIKAGRGGDVTITANDLTLLGGARISARTLDASPGGSVTLKIANQLQLTDTSLVTANTLAAGKGGNVSVSAGQLIVTSGATLSAGTSGTGAGGDVNVRANTIQISAGGSSKPTLISAESTDTGHGGRGGDVLIDAGTLRISGSPDADTGVSATSKGFGSSGSVTLNLDTLAMDSNALIGSSNTGGGNAGSVVIRTKDGVALTGASLITTSAAKADAGNIIIDSSTGIELSGGSSITASAGSNGGSIQIVAKDFLRLTDSSITATAGSVQLAAAAGGGAGGNIFVDPTFIILDHSLISANAAIGQGGNILLVAQNFLPSETPITATGTTAGTVQITAPPLDLANALAALQATFVDVSSRLQERCAIRLGQDFSSFLVLGRGGMEEIPDEPQVESSRRKPASTGRR